MSTTELYMNSEKAMLAQYILSIDNYKTLDAVKQRLYGFVRIKMGDKSRSSDDVLDMIAGRWVDDRSADEMVDEIYQSRTKEKMSEYKSPFDV